MGDERSEQEEQDEYLRHEWWGTSMDEEHDPRETVRLKNGGVICRDCADEVA